MTLLYLSILIVLICCMVLCDWRWNLAFFRDFKRASLLCLSMVIAFIIWDISGIVTGTFSRGSSPYMTGIEIAPELPIEEPFFLFFLTYLTINLVSGIRGLVERIQSK